MLNESFVAVAVIWSQDLCKMQIIRQSDQSSFYCVGASVTNAPNVVF